MHPFDWVNPLYSLSGLVSLLTGSIPGIVLGSWFAVRVPETVLRPIMAGTLVLIGARLVF
jgi:uncharacterized membrane protein YfcA